MTEQTQILEPSCTDGFNEEVRRLRFDPEAYAKYIAELDLSEDEKYSLMRTVWDLMVMFVDAGFGIDAPTLASKNAENAAASSTKSALPKPEEEVAP